MSIYAIIYKNTYKGSEVKMIGSIINYQDININSLYGIKALSNAYINNYSNAGKSIYRGNAYSIYDKSNAKFISSYTSNLSNLKEINSKLNSTNKNSVLNTIAASSSDEKVATAKTFFTPREKATYQLNVSQTSKSQINTSDALKSDDMSSMGISDINISDKNKNYSFTVDTTGKTNKEALQDIAAKINKSNIGISAIVNEKNNKSVLQLIGDKTGENEDFSVTGSDEFMLQTNLSNITQMAEDAVFDVTKDGNILAQNKKSSSNEIDIDGYKVSATLKDAGKTTISLNIDKKKISEAINSFVSAYNTTLDFLESNVNKGSAISRQLENLKIPEINKKSLGSIGIDIEKDGRLSVDSKALNNALDKNISEVESPLSNRYSAFSKLDSRINGALKESSISLIDGSLYSQENRNSDNSLLDRLNLLSIYNNGGKFGMINQSAIGLILNMFA